jgi:hypothetical protein
MKVFSFGGGVQSMAVMILSAQGRLDYTDFVFANVGDDSENPESLVYIRDVAEPYAAAHGLRIHHVRRTKRDGSHVSILQDAMADNSNISIPVYLSNGGPASRNCTSNWKVKVIEKWMRANGNATKTARQPLGVGISADETHRMRTDDPEREPYVYKEYPLVDLRVTRAECQRIISAAGVGLAPKSSCFFCPYKRRSDWAKMRGDQPELFAISVALEERLNEKRRAAGKDAVYLTASDKPLTAAIAQPTENMFADDEDPMHCESGYCMT